MTPQAQERIKADAEATNMFNGYKLGYIAGATAENERAQEELKNAQDAAAMFCNKYNVVATQLAEMVDEAQKLVEALEKILLQHTYYDVIELAANALQQYNAATPARPCPHCGKELNRDRNLCCRECGKEVENG